MLTWYIIHSEFMFIDMMLPLFKASNRALERLPTSSLRLQYCRHQKEKPMAGGEVEDSIINYAVTLEKSGSGDFQMLQSTGITIS